MTPGAFRIRSFRFQWSADLLTSWAFEMETLILGWYVLVETQSVLMLSVFGALQYLGTIFAPMSGVLGHQHAAVDGLPQPRALHLARLEYDVAVRQDHRRAEASHLLNGA